MNSVFSIKAISRISRGNLDLDSDDSFPKLVAVVQFCFLLVRENSYSLNPLMRCVIGKVTAKHAQLVVLTALTGMR